MSYAGADYIWMCCTFSNDTLGGKFLYATLLIEHGDIEATEGNTGMYSILDASELWKPAETLC